MSAGKGVHLGLRLRAMNGALLPPTKPHLGAGQESQPFRGPWGISHSRATGLSSLSTWEERSLLGTLNRTEGKELLSFFQGKRGTSGPPSPPTGPYLGGDVGD